MEETLKILVVDDDEVDRMTVHRALTQAGVLISLSEANTCSEAIIKAHAHSYDCIFLDYRLPDGDGLTLISQLREANIKVPLVVLTGQSDELVAVELMKAGANDYLSKSRVSSETLAQVLRNAIRVYRAEMQAEQAMQQLRESNKILVEKNKELEQQRQQIQQQNVKLLEASQLKSKFLATISHELRTPMNAIIGFSQFLLRPKYGSLSNSQRDMVERILSNGKHLLGLLNEVLDFSKIESGQLELKPQIYDISTVVNSTVGEMMAQASMKKLSLEVTNKLDNSIVYSDPLRVKQILANLLSNAIKFTKAGGVYIDIESRSENKITISVRDTGIGIASNETNKIFEVFRQLDQEINREYPGTGLGLAIVKALVNMMSGTIEVESRLGLGTTFRVEIPRQVGNGSALEGQLMNNFVINKSISTKQDILSSPSDRG
ncbi:response regulator receiver sensor signal transduction histidine kinase [Calothrix sp. NIES-4071]|nr:response regulator receiver sensor signal transduction histidine kinase [Calothrix sp. NIES-4071]BAZ60946.1 response regulator receiver sensor signal transduction histidine kinase [Calothrix sp. NIES-4105]